LSVYIFKKSINIYGLNATEYLSCMKSISLYGIALLILITSCNNKKLTVPILQPANLASSFISLNVDSSYTLKTQKGAIIKIAKNSFDVPANTTVRIEVKEAYTMQDILLAGLTTKSNGRLLQSGGMIYFNASANGNDVKITKPIRIGIPTSNYNDSMQLFKGEVKADSTINWVDPTPLDSNDVSKELALGKALFQGNCANCHKPTEDFTGPALASARKREPNPEWAYHFINNVNTMLITSTYARSLRNKFGSTMTQQNLSPLEIRSILDYCDNEATRICPNSNYSINTTLNSPDSFIVNTDTTKSVNNAPCGYDTVYYEKIDTTSQVVPQYDSSDISIVDTSFYSQQPDPATLYQFSINLSGWYNIDCFIDANRNNVTSVFLSAAVNNIIDADSMELYLCVPTRKLVTEGSIDNSKKIFFYERDYSIPLILKDSAIIIAVGRINDKLYYGEHKFVVADSQVINVIIKESSKNKINQYIHQNGLDKKNTLYNTNKTPIQINIDNTNTNIIPSIDGKIIKEITPKNCNGNGETIFSVD